MRFTPDGKTWVNSSGVMVRVSLGRRVSHPIVASGGRRKGCRLWSLASLWVVAVWASGSMSAQVYEATLWPAFRTASSPVAIPPQSSTRWRARVGMVYVGREVSEGSAGASLGVGRGGLGRHAGGVIGDMVAGQVGRGRVCCIGGGVIEYPLVVLVFGKNLSCSAVSWQTCWRAGAKICVMRYVFTNRFLPS